MTWRRYGEAFVLGAAVALVAASVASAAERERPRFKDQPDAAKLAAPQAVTADAPNSRLVALVRAPDGKLVMEKGVKNITNPELGVYCIRPEAATGIDPATAVVVVSVEYFYSLFNEVQVQWARRNNGCGANRIAIYTFADENLNGVYTPSDAVGFVVYVP
jgi:hypothetical protein